MLEQLINKVQDLLQPKERRRLPREAPEEALGKRALMRKRERLSEGFLTSERMITPRPCTLRDLTVLGSRVDLWDDIYPSLMKNGVTLYIVADRKEIDCEVTWRRGNSLGLRFLGAPREPTRSYERPRQAAEKIASKTKTSDAD